MADFRKILAGLCAVLLVVSGVMAGLLFNLERGFFSADTFQQAFEKQNLYARVPAILADVLYNFIEQDSNADPYLKVLTVQDWATSITMLLPPEELKRLSDGVLASFFDYLNNNANSVTVSLLPLKGQLAGPQGTEVMLLIIKAQPDCTAEQLLQMGLGIFTGDIALCSPPEEMMGFVTPLVQSQLPTLMSAIPDEVALIPEVKSGMPERLHSKLNTARAWMAIMPVIPIFFLAGILIFGVRSLLDWLMWWGWPLLATGVLTFLLAALGSPILGLVFQMVFQNQAGGFLPPVLTSLIGETVSAVSVQILKPAVIEGLILGIVGLGMVLSAVYLSKTRAEK